MFQISTLSCAPVSSRILLVRVHIFSSWSCPPNTRLRSQACAFSHSLTALFLLFQQNPCPSLTALDFLADGLFLPSIFHQSHDDCATGACSGGEGDGLTLTARESGRALSKKCHKLQCATSYDLCNFCTLLQKEPSYPSNFPEKKSINRQTLCNSMGRFPTPLFFGSCHLQTHLCHPVRGNALELIIMMMIDIYISLRPCVSSARPRRFTRFLVSSFSFIETPLNHLTEWVVPVRT